MGTKLTLKYKTWEINFVLNDVILKGTNNFPLVCHISVTDNTSDNTICPDTLSLPVTIYIQSLKSVGTHAIHDVRNWS